MLAFSVANQLEFPNQNGEYPTSYKMELINDHFCEDIYSAAVQAVEEAVINAMIAAETVPTVKPPGYTLDAIDHDQLMELMKQYNRL